MLINFALTNYASVTFFVYKCIKNEGPRKKQLLSPHSWKKDVVLGKQKNIHFLFNLDVNFLTCIGSQVTIAISPTDEIRY